MINTHFPTIFYSLLLSIFLRRFYVYCIRAVENALCSAERSVACQQVRISRSRNICAVKTGRRFKSASGESLDLRLS